MISRRTFVVSFVKAVSLGSLLLVIEFLKSCTYRKKDSYLPQSLTEKKLKLVYPAGGEHYETSTIAVGWIAENIERINILLSYDAGLSWNYLEKNIHSLALKATITLPSFAIFADDCLLKIEDVENNNIYVVSAATFSIHKGSSEDSIQLLNPVGGELLLAQQPFEIKWASVNVTNFTIQLLVNGSLWTNIASNVQGNSYTWQVDSVRTVNAKIVVKNADNAAVYDVTKTPFGIATEHVIDLNVHTELQNTGGYKIFEDVLLLGTFVVKKISATEYKTYSMSCTHNGCLIGLNMDQSFSCPCHGSTFDDAGNVTHGPAQSPLVRWRTEYLSAENKLVVYSY